MYNDGAWPVHPGQGFEDDMMNGGVHTTWTGPINTQMYGTGLTDLCNRTRDNINRLSLQMQKLDPCFEYGIKHWHPTKRPKSAIARMKAANSGHADVMFGDSSTLDSSSVRDDSDFIDPPAPINQFCYLCSTLEEHKRHLLHHKPKKRPASARPRVMYIAPRPKVKKKEEKDDKILVRERLYKVEVFTSDVANAGTTAKVFIAIKGSLDVLPRTQLIKKRGCSKMCLVQNSHEVFHIKGPCLGNLQILSIEHDGKDRKQAWHLDRVEVTDVKALKTWVFVCREWLSIFHKPLYSNRVDLQATEKDRPLTEYNIEIHTGKQKMAGTDSNIFITLTGKHGSSKKIHLVDPHKDKRLFEKNSVDKFCFRMHSLGEMRMIRIEHDGKGFAAGWFFDKAVVYSSDEPSHKYYFVYGGWIAKDEGEGKLWREIKAKKSMPKELQHGTDTKYQVITKTGDVRFAGTDADVFIQMAGANGMTPKLNIDNAKNNFERKMTDNFEVTSVNVGPLKHIVVGHDNSGPGAGWFLDTVTVRRYVPKDEALSRLKTMKKKLKAKKTKQQLRKKPQDRDDESDIDIREKIDQHEREKREAKKKKKEDKKKDGGNFFSVSSESEDSSSSSESETEYKKKRRDSKQQRPGSALRRSLDRDGRGRKQRSSSSESDEEDRKGKDYRSRRPSSALRRSYDKDYGGKKRRSSSTESDDRRSSFSTQQGRRASSASTQRRQSYSPSQRRTSTSVSGMKQLEKEGRKGKDRKKRDAGDVDDDDNVDELKVPLYEEYEFVCRRWLAVDEDDGLCVRELPVAKKTTYYKEH